MTEGRVGVPHQIRRHWFDYAALLTLVLVYWFLRISAGYEYVTVDEAIPVRVIEQIQRSGSWDTNWALTRLPDYFRYDQYNFSSYIVTCAVGFKTVLLLYDRLDILFFLRAVSALFHSLAVILTYLLAKQLLETRWAAAVAAAAVACFPLLFQDSLYARPESFCTALSVLALILLQKAITASTPGKIAAVGFVVGLLIACKITFVTLLVLSAALLVLEGGGLPPRLQRVAALLAATAAGFVAGAPYALANVSAYLNGISELLAQYSGGQPPHGLTDASTLERLAYAWQYFVSTGTWLLLLLAAAGVLLFARERKYSTVLSGGLFLTLLLYFCSKPVFFERNFSFAIPLLATCAVKVVVAASATVSGKTARLAVAGVASALLLAGPLAFLLYLNANVFNNTLQRQRVTAHRKFAAQGLPLSVFGYLLDEVSFQSLKEKSAARPPGTIYEIWGVNDVYTERFLKRAEAALGMKKISEIRSPLQEKEVPASTLYTYHAPQYIFLLQTR